MGRAKSNRRPVASTTSTLARATARAMASAFAGGRAQRVSSSVPSMSMAISRTGIVTV